MENELIKDFYYNTLDADAKLQLRVRESEIEVLIGQTELYARQTIVTAIETGKKLIEARELFRHNKNGGFSGWWEKRFGKSKQTAYNYINIAERFNSQTVGRLDFDLSALHLLAAPSVSDEAREKAIKKAEGGETITKSVARGIIDSQKEDEKKQELQKFYDELDPETRSSLQADEIKLDRHMKKVAFNFIDAYNLTYEVCNKLGQDEYIKWFMTVFNTSEDTAKRVLEAYERFGSNPELTRELAGRIINEYSSEIFTLAGFGEVLAVNS